jgi:crotonobetainyl-CoA:carnitine CoA-transferase CaiB-like acyl-CoA transferase
MYAAAARWWACPLDVETFAEDAVGRVRDAAAQLARARGLDLRIETDPALTAASFAAIEHLRIDGRAPSAWAELSGFARAADGWVRLHGNYPHHAAALQELYGIRDRDELDRALAVRPAAEIEQEVAAAGGIAVAVRTEEEWRAHPQQLATAEEPWTTVLDRGARSALPAPGGPGSAGAASTGSPPPLHGVRVLDLTRVIAGPTASQLLACLGADVLRIDPPHRPELLDQHLSTGMGKRSAVLDLRRPDHAARARELAATADVILDGYRPGALARHGLGTEDLETLAPQAVIVSLSAWGERGPWGRRPGFDSIVQAATGIAVRCGSAEKPGALPVQALDHATGHRVAAHVLEALAADRAVTVRASLLGAARTLLAAAPPASEEVVAPAMEVEGTPGDVGSPTTEVDVPPLDVVEPVVPRVCVVARGAEQMLEAVPPPLLLDGRTIEQDVPEYGAAEPVWSRSAVG